MHCSNLRLVLGLGLVRVSSRVRVKVMVSVLVRVSIRTSWVVNLALFRCYRPVIYTRPKQYNTDVQQKNKGRLPVRHKMPINAACLRNLNNILYSYIGKQQRRMHTN